MDNESVASSSFSNVDTQSRYRYKWNYMVLEEKDFHKLPLRTEREIAQLKKTLKKTYDLQNFHLGLSKFQENQPRTEPEIDQMTTTPD